MYQQDSSAYDTFADIYDAIGQGRLSERLANLAQRLQGPPGLALDLCCGTGLACLQLERSGWSAQGVDSAGAMLAIAADRARDMQAAATFLKADIRGELPNAYRTARYRLVTCLGDSLSELLGDTDLAVALSQAAEVLEPHGALVFDLRRAALLEQWDAYDEVLHDAHGILAYVRRDYAGRTGLASSRFVWFVDDIDRWWRDETTILSRLWSDTAIVMALEHAGLRLEARLTLDGNPAESDDPWTVFVARRAL
jgi:SAM-dependent methyltransferase